MDLGLILSRGEVVHRLFFITLIFFYGCSALTSKDKHQTVTGQHGTPNAYWSCQCFESKNSGSPDMMVNIINTSRLHQAEEKAFKKCSKNNGYGLKSPIVRCHKYVSGPSH